jgi:hypothetical protein
MQGVMVKAKQHSLFPSFIDDVGASSMKFSTSDTCRAAAVEFTLTSANLYLFNVWISQD